MTDGAPPMDGPAPSQPAERCMLGHRVFTSLGDPLFRRAETDGMPAMVVMLGERQAVVPLRSLQREFGIADESPDGQMLALIAQSLDFIAALHIGDLLPTEVLSGQASWEPDEVHFQIANARLQWQLVGWLNSGTGTDTPALDAEALLQVADDPARRQLVQDAFTKAAETLGLPSREAVIQLVEELARELAYIEALRDRLLRRVKAMAEKLGRVAQAYRGDGSHLETLTQVRRLSGTALKQIGHRFEELDAQTGEVMATLRNVDSQRTFIRSNRDWLYRTQRAWHPLLTEWDTAGISFDEGMMALLARSYQFLAPRFMPVTEWASVTRPAKRKAETTRQMVW
ncbi:MAG TPA: hypothetical protein VFL55_26025 [Acetobacteraceae bacterium]|nr:hypothetical protein [Acetobacteraceae bacterium]